MRVSPNPGKHTSLSNIFEQANMSEQENPNPPPSPADPSSGGPSSSRPASRRPASATGRIAIAAALLGAVIFVCVNLVSAQMLSSARVDFTQQHLYSLSQGSRSLLASLNEPVRFRLFMSSELTTQAPQLAAFAARVRSLLDAYVAASNGHIILEVVDPRPFSEDEDRAVAFGIDGFAGQGGERLFFRQPRRHQPATTGSAHFVGVFSPDR